MLRLELLPPPARALPCVAAGPDLYFSESPRELEKAKVLCRPCPLRVACLAGAKERREPWGVWGGEVFVDGHPVPYKRAPGAERQVKMSSGRKAETTKLGTSTSSLTFRSTATLQIA